MSDQFKKSQIRSDHFPPNFAFKFYTQLQRPTAQLALHGKKQTFNRRIHFKFHTNIACMPINTLASRIPVQIQAIGGYQSNPNHPPLTLSKFTSFSIVCLWRNHSQFPNLANREKDGAFFLTHMARPQVNTRKMYTLNRQTASSAASLRISQTCPIKIPSQTTHIHPCYGHHTQKPQALVFQPINFVWQNTYSQNQMLDKIFIFPKQFFKHPIKKILVQKRLKKKFVRKFLFQ